MMRIEGCFDRYKEAILALPLDRLPEKADLLVDEFLLHRDGKLEMYFAPHNEYINTGAKLMIIGITPGWNQMRIAFHAARKGLERGISSEQICQQAKEEASFAGTMRNNLIAMLNQLDLPHVLGMMSCDELFSQQRHLLHTTSLLKYPVFVDQRNYTGHNPNLLTTPFLREYALKSLSEELALLGPVFIIPLGKTVESLLRVLIEKGRLNEDQCAWGFPHPSGANGHRRSQLEENSESMKLVIRKWFKP